MADVVITPANVLADSSAKVEHGTAGELVNAGKVVYKVKADGKLKLADNNNVVPPEAHMPRGIALNTAAAGQPLAIITFGALTVGGTLVPNVTYYLSDTPGGICREADLVLPVATGEYPTILGMAMSATVLNIDIQSTGGKM